MNRPALTDYTITTGQVAKRFGVSIGTVRRWVDDGILAGITRPGGWLKFRDVDVDDLEQRILNGEFAA